MRRHAGHALLAGWILTSIGCAIPHEYARVDRSGPMIADVEAASSGALAVTVRFAAGGVKIGTASSGRLYEAVVTHCATHTADPEVSFGPGGDPDPATLTVSLQGRPGGISFGGEHNGLALGLAPGVPLALDLSVGEGESVVDLSGLDVTALRLIGGAGDARLVFGTPNRIVLEELHVESLLGDVSVDRLGNANARRVVVIGGVGAVELDLTGEWRRDAAVLVEGSVGDVVLALPPSGRISLAVGPPWSEGLALDGYTLRDGVFYSSGYDGPGPRVDMTIEAGIGALGIERIEAEAAIDRDGPPPGRSGEGMR